MDQELKNQYPLTSDDLLIHLCVPQIFTRCLPTIICVFVFFSVLICFGADTLVTNFLIVWFFSMFS